MLADGIELIEGSSTSNLVLPNLTESQKNNLTLPNIGEVIYQTTGDTGLYVYNGTAWSKISTTSGGLLNTPAYTGDVTSSVGSTVLTLTSVVSPGTYTKVTVDGKGRVTAGVAPSTAAGLGITDVYTRTDIDNMSRVNSINGKTGVISKIVPADISGLAPSATTDTTNADNITTGKLSAALFSNVFGGDIVIPTSAPFVASLKSRTVAGTYNKLNVNAQGLVTSATLETTLVGMGVTDGLSSSLLPSGNANATNLQIVMGNDTRLTNARTPIAHVHTSADITDIISKTSDLVTSTIQYNTNILLDGVPTEGNTLNKLYHLFTAGNVQLQVPSLAARDALDITTTAVTVFVEDIGDGTWAVYKPATTGVAATFMMLLQKTDFAANTGTSVEVTANKDTDGSFIENSDDKYPSQRAVKTYVDSRIRSAGPQGAGAIASSVHSVNGYTPDLNGNVVTPYIATINGVHPNSSHDISLTNLLTINNVQPNSSGVVMLDMVSSINNKSGAIDKILPSDTSGIFDSNYTYLASSNLPAFTGDITSVGGTSNLLLSSTGVVAGTYNSVTVDTKGRVTAGTSNQYHTTNASDLTSGTLNSARLPAFTGDVSSVSGSSNMALSTMPNFTPGTYNNVTVDDKGRVTGGNTFDVLPIRVIRRNTTAVTYNLPVSTLAGYNSLPLTIRKANGTVVNYTVPSNAI